MQDLDCIHEIIEVPSGFESTTFICTLCGDYVNPCGDGECGFTTVFNHYSPPYVVVCDCGGESED